MKTVPFTTSKLESIQKDLEGIKAQMKNVTSSSFFVTHKEFIRIMDISDRTAQTWRDNGEIGFSKKGKKIYYRMADIEQFLIDCHKAPFANPEKSI